MSSVVGELGKLCTRLEIFDFLDAQLAEPQDVAVIVAKACWGCAFTRSPYCQDQKAARAQAGRRLQSCLPKSSKIGQHAEDGFLAVVPTCNLARARCTAETMRCALMTWATLCFPTDLRSSVEIAVAVRRAGDLDKRADLLRPLPGFVAALTLERM